MNLAYAPCMVHDSVKINLDEYMGTIDGTNTNMHITGVILGVITGQLSGPVKLVGASHFNFDISDFWEAVGTDQQIVFDMASGVGSARMQISGISKIAYSTVDVAEVCFSLAVLMPAGAFGANAVLLKADTVLEKKDVGNAMVIRCIYSITEA